MLTINATKARNEWSSLIESVIREKPAIIKKTRDYLFFTNMNVLKDILAVYSFHAEALSEDDGSVTITLDEIDLAENAPNLQEAVSKLARAILEYSEDYYNEFAYWSRGDRKAHIPYIFKALILNDVNKIGSLIKCRRGKI
ncbi:MAG: hypothetical protein FWD13_00850 [Treponema sp.]|nr:hypothetical protein [Treponema sp.]